MAGPSGHLLTIPTDRELMNKIVLLLFVLMATATFAFAQEAPQVIWESDAAATNLAFSADGATMYSGGSRSMPPFTYGNIKKWDVETRTEIYTLIGGGSGVIGLTNGLAVTPDGTAFASGHGNVRCPAEGPCVTVANGFQTWNAVSGESQFDLNDDDIDGLVKSVAFSHDGQFVAFVMNRTSEDQIRVYNYPEYTFHGSYDGHGSGTYCVAFSPIDNTLVTGGYDGDVRMWNIGTHELLRTLEHGSYTNGGYPISLDFSSDGSQLAVSGAGYNLKATVWDVSSGDLIHSLSADSGTYGTSSARIAFSPNGNYLVGGVMRYASPEWQGVIQIWDLDDGSLVRMYSEEALGAVGSRMSVAVSAASDGWIAYTYDNQIKFAETGLDFGGRQAITPVPNQLDPRQLSVRAHPNPFNPMTTVSFTLDRELEVRLSVLDVKGNRVAELFSGVMPSGEHPVQWNGKDSTGRDVSSGNYVIYMEAEGSIETSKMMLVR